MRRYLWPLLSLVFLFSPLHASFVSVGYMQVLADSPTAGDQELTILNNTGSNCSPAYPACSNLNFINWALTVTFTSTYYNATGPSLPDPYVVTSATYGAIAPSSANNVFDFDLCGGVNINNGCTPATSISSVEFRGQIAPASFCLYDATAAGCPASNATTFFASPQFDLVWNQSSPSTPYVDENNIYTFSPDITVTDQPSGSSTPEPGSFWLLAAVCPAWFLVRLFRRA